MNHVFSKANQLGENKNIEQFWNASGFTTVKVQIRSRAAEGSLTMRDASRFTIMMLRQSLKGKDGLTSVTAAGYANQHV